MYNELEWCHSNFRPQTLGDPIYVNSSLCLSGSAVNVGGVCVVEYIISPVGFKDTHYLVTVY